MTSERDPVSLEDVAITGAVHVERTDTGVIPSRLAPWARAQLPPSTTALADPMAPWAMPSGVRLSFWTDATALELDVLTTQIQASWWPDTQPTFDLVVDGELAQTVRADAGHRHVLERLDEPPVFHAGGAETIRFDKIPPHQVCEIWLCQAASVELRALRADGTVRPVVPAVPRWVHYGSSVSHCRDAHSPARTWPAIVARRRGLDLLNLGFGGNCLLDPFVARTIRDEPADLISVKVGVNLVFWDSMKARTFVPALHGFLDTVRDRHPTTPLVVASSVICPLLEDRPGPIAPGEDGFRVVEGPRSILPGEDLTLRRTRELIVELVESRRRGDPNLHYLDGLSLFGEDDGFRLRDGFHPDGDGYELLAERFDFLVFGAGGPFESR